VTEQQLCELDPHQHESMFYGTEPYHILEFSSSDCSSEDSASVDEEA